MVIWSQRGQERVPPLGCGMEPSLGREVRGPAAPPPCPSPTFYAVATLQAQPPAQQTHLWVCGHCIRTKRSS